ncbi:hypothetical protein [uncultured Roseovarius sp.]|uniref:hypothetical protein n=1 Tax=uncultured Roseovarius sp. TaxID=293344 RepID=UPI00260FEF98|nr:hypothetical protein [uncultured Roseovarius sp.]
MHHHIPMLTPFLSWALMLISGASFYFHWYNRNNAGWLLKYNQMELATMARRGEDNMGIDCAIMGFGMGLHNLDFLPAWLIFWVGLGIVAFRAYVLAVTIKRSRRIYRFKWDTLRGGLGDLTR